MTDLTAITTPFGLLDDATREALKAHGGPYEFWNANCWEEVEPAWSGAVAYRVKPQPPKPREFVRWGVYLDDKYQGSDATEAGALLLADIIAGATVVKLTGVIE
jgi:hypothetical protein